MTLFDALIICQIGWKSEAEGRVYSQARGIINRHGHRIMDGCVDELPCPTCGYQGDD